MNDRIYRFAEFELLSAEGELRTGDSCVRLQEKPLRLLTVLLDNAQRLVTREQLRERMWDSDTFVDYELGINVGVKKVRDALGDSAENPRFIQTVAKKGYRFLVPVEVSSLEIAAPTVSASSPAAAEPAAIPEATPGHSRTVRRRWTFALLAMGVLSALGFWLVQVQAKHRHVTQIRSLAVLPLRNLSPDSGQEYFADGITEELITNLAQSLPLRVISRTSVMRYKQTEKPITEIARELGVEAIVEGAVARSGNQVTVTVQLIDATEDRHLWAQTYHRDLGDLLGMEAELAQRIASQVGGTLTSNRQIKAEKPRPIDPKVYELYLKGRYFWNKRTDEGVMRAAEYFQQAVDQDANYAPAYAGLADCYLFGQPPTLPPKVLAAKIKEMAKRALALDDGLAEAHATLGLLAQNFEWNWAEAEREYKRAINLNPNYATAHQWYGGELELTGRFDDALEEMKIASDLDPLSLIIIKDTGEVYYVERKYDRATGYFRKALEMDPNFVIARLNLGLVYAQEREFSSALAELQKARQLQDGPYVLSELGYVCALSGKRREAQEILSDLKVISEQRYVFPTDYAIIYAGLGDKDKAFEWLEKGYRDGGLLVGLKVDPHWDNLRNDARFADLMKRVGLAP
jgi:TolB-like protein/DNA-binding winged helix-turn-helix (wHTH) protein/Tfp pilus assembly protein PilF